MEKRAQLLDQLAAHTNSEIADAATRLKGQLAERIEAERRRETARDRDRDERFE